MKILGIVLVMAAGLIGYLSAEYAVALFMGLGGLSMLAYRAENGPQSDAPPEVVEVGARIEYAVQGLKGGKWRDISHLTDAGTFDLTFDSPRKAREMYEIAQRSIEGMDIDGLRAVRRTVTEEVLEAVND